MPRIRKSKRDRKVKSDRKVPSVAGRNIARLRAYRDLTQEELAEKIQIDKQRMGRLERSEAKLLFEEGIAIAKVLECLPEELIEEGSQ